MVLPEGLPFWDNPHFAIDDGLIAEIGAYYLAEQGDDADELTFYGGYLPLVTADLLCAPGVDKPKMNTYLGNMYLSGYWGGVWLRDVLFSNDIEGSEEPSGGPMDRLMEQLTSLIPGMEQLMSGGGERSIFNGVVAAAGEPVKIAFNGEPVDITMANRGSMEMLLMIYGYDYGYYYYLVDNPPNGIEKPEDPLICNEFLDCRMADLDLVTLNAYKPVLDKLFDPACAEDGDRWCILNRLVNQVGRGAVAQGDSTWDGIMSSNTMLDPAYAPLMDLSARFMLVSELTLLPSMKGWAERDLEAGRCGLFQAGAMVAWLGGYVSGLSSTLEEGIFPELNGP